MLFIHVQERTFCFSFTISQWRFQPETRASHGAPSHGLLLSPVVQGISVTPDMGSGPPLPSKVADSQQASSFSTNCRTLQAQGWGVQAGPSTQLPRPVCPHLPALCTGWHLAPSQAPSQPIPCRPAYGGLIPASRRSQGGICAPGPQSLGLISAGASIPRQPGSGGAKSDQRLCSRHKDTLIFATATRPIQLKIITGLFQVFIPAQCADRRSHRTMPFVTHDLIFIADQGSLAAPPPYLTPIPGRSRGFLR